MSGDSRGALAAGFLRNHMREYGILIALIVIMAFFQIATDGILLRPVNLTNLVLQNSYIIVMALGMLLVIVAGHIDLSVGSVMGFIGALAAVMMVTYDINPLVTSVVCMAVGFAIGAAQGYWIAYFKIPSFIVTLAGLLIFKGAILLILGGASIGPFPNFFRLLSTGFLPDVFDATRFNTLSFLIGAGVAVLVFAFAMKQRFSGEGDQDEPTALFVGRQLLVAAALIYLSWLMANFRGLPNVLVVMAILIAIYSFITNKTTAGRRVYAIGGNEKAAKLSGINTERLTMLVFANMGMLAALGGLIFAARLNVAQPKAGQVVELDVIAAVFIGGASMRGGVGTILGAVVGAFIMGVLNNGMSLLGIGIDYQQMIKGLVLLAAVIFDVLNKRDG
ncbi:sugar ABC transporter permease [Acuticoccus sp. MNP-M23]|nr:multiple monosaccharide ABC transporter permease [Acuticoccus sp. MNP-M23]WMS42488.1 sugar ABC transporter permease [Acuticoccus sp. MNP-M23]